MRFFLASVMPTNGSDGLQNVGQESPRLLKRGIAVPYL